jgi:hypothetical protein
VLGVSHGAVGLRAVVEGRGGVQLALPSSPGGWLEHWAEAQRAQEPARRNQC